MRKSVEAFYATSRYSIPKIDDERKEHDVKMIFWLALILVLALAVPAAFAGEGMDMTPYTGSPQFEQIKKLAGTWEGSEISEHAQPDSKVKVQYEVISNGSAVEERLFPGTPHEMVSIYSDKNGKPAMTHYCAMGNQPEMSMIDSDEKHITFDFSQGNMIDPAKDTYMHGLNLIWTDADHLTAEWTLYQAGKEAGKTVFKLARVK